MVVMPAGSYPSSHLGQSDWHAVLISALSVRPRLQQPLLPCAYFGGPPRETTLVLIQVYLEKLTKLAARHRSMWGAGLSCSAFLSLPPLYLSVQTAAKGPPTRLREESSRLHPKAYRAHLSNGDGAAMPMAPYA
ncbi:unnamed protein product [Boreogadus saida]